MSDFLLAILSNEATRVFCFPGATRLHYGLAQLRSIRHIWQHCSSILRFIVLVSWNLTHALAFLISFVSDGLGLIRTTVVGALEETKYLSSVVAIKQSQCVTLILYFFLFYSSLRLCPACLLSAQMGPSTFRMMRSIESLAKLCISQNQVHLRELHYKDSIGLKF